jgi:hypothetical protein
MLLTFASFAERELFVTPGFEAAVAQRRYASTPLLKPFAPLSPRPPAGPAASLLSVTVRACLGRLSGLGVFHSK